MAQWLLLPKTVRSLNTDQGVGYKVGAYDERSRMDDFNTYLDGKRLFGDDFDNIQIADWYADEKEGYAELGAKDSASYKYGYHFWNTYHAYRNLPSGTFPHVLGFGSAYGDELLPIVSRIEKITIRIHQMLSLEKLWMEYLLTILSHR